MFPNDHHFLSKGKPLPSILRDRRVERGVADRYRCGRCNNPADVLCASIPQFDLEGAGGKNLMQVRIGELPEQLIDAEIQLGRCSPHAFALGAQFFYQAKRMELAILFDRSVTHENKMRTIAQRVKSQLGKVDSR
jgi:hypothetical protein